MPREKFQQRIRLDAFQEGVVFCVVFCMADQIALLAITVREENNAVGWISVALPSMCGRSEVATLIHPTFQMHISHNGVLRHARARVS